MDGARIRSKLTRQLAAALSEGSSLFSRMVVGHWLVYSLRRKSSSTAPISCSIFPWKRNQRFDRSELLQ
jgi:hypothetical protein